MGCLQGSLGSLRAVDQFHPPVLVASAGMAQGGQIGQFPQQPRHGRQSGFFHVLKSGFQRHLVTNSERSKVCDLYCACRCAMKLSRSNSQSQGENNRETYATSPRSSRTVSQYFGGSNRSPGRRRTHQYQLWQNYCASRKLCKPDFLLRKRNKNRTTLPPAAGRGIVPCYRHAAGALTSLALPLGCAQRPSS